jgi:hypothetical protein
MTGAEDVTEADQCRPPGMVRLTDGLGPNARTVARLRGPQPVRCEICQWRGRRLKPRSAPCPACGSRVEFA